jgi:EamA domain-containing membrane protein RarD
MKFGITVLIIGFCIEIYGALQKILHTPSADAFLKTGMITMIIATVIIVYKIFEQTKKRNC